MTVDVMMPKLNTHPPERIEAHMNPGIIIDTEKIKFPLIGTEERFLSGTET